MINKFLSRIGEGDGIDNIIAKLAQGAPIEKQKAKSDLRGYLAQFAGINGKIPNDIKDNEVAEYAKEAIGLIYGKGACRNFPSFLEEIAAGYGEDHLAALGSIYPQLKELALKMGYETYNNGVGDAFDKIERAKTGTLSNDEVTMLVESYARKHLTELSDELDGEDTEKLLGLMADVWTKGKASQEGRQMMTMLYLAELSPELDGSKVEGLVGYGKDISQRMVRDGKASTYSGFKAMKETGNKLYTNFQGYVQKINENN